MRHSKAGALAILAGAAVIAGTAGAALGQDESPAAEASPMEEASPMADASPMEEVVEPSTIGIQQVLQAGSANSKLKGKKYDRAIKKAAPNAVQYLIKTGDADAIQRIIELSSMARVADEAGDGRASKALLALATAIYRNAWTTGGGDPLALNDTIAGAIAADYAGQPGLAFDTPDGLIDICLMKTEEWIYNGATPSLCEEAGGRQVRAAYARVDESKNATLDLYDGPNKNADIGGVGIHKVVQDKTANDKLKGKKLRKAIAKAAPAVARYRAEGSGAGTARGVIDMVQLARAADEAGDTKAAKAFLALALAAYRGGWTRDGTSAAASNDALVQLITDQYAGAPGLDVHPPEGMVDICLLKEKHGTDYMVDQAAPWECGLAKGRALRVPIEDIDPDKNGTHELYTGDS